MPLRTRRARTRSAWRRRLPAPPAPPPAPLPYNVLADLPHTRSFARTCAAARLLAAQADAPLRSFFESCEEALLLVDEELRRPPPPVFWGGGANDISRLPEDRLDFAAMLRAKCEALVAFRACRRVRLTHADSGFFAAFLGVLDSLLLSHPAAEVSVEWRRGGGEQHFTYWPAARDACVWRELFEPIGVRAEPCDGVPSLSRRWNFFFGGRFRWRLRHSRFARGQRHIYHQTYRRWVRLRHPQLLHEAATIGKALREGESIGVHKRVDTPGTAAYQGAKRVPSAAEFVEAVRRVAARMARAPTHIYLATDCAHSVEVFRAAFGEALVVRQDVQRTRGGVNADCTLNEAHILSPHNPEPGFGNALAVLGDAMLLSQCRRVIHMDSNVTSAVSIMNPDTEMLHIVDVLTD
ncbi:hypothetical protein AB1Y20_007274 [Prymnesium parvum]|uniref:Uncharacterized protein n=1 Tax=Prymnesium parvum TaxID=97485 RepID=A0AB34IWV7_PRYPA